MVVRTLEGVVQRLLLQQQQQRRRTVSPVVVVVVVVVVGVVVVVVVVVVVRLLQRLPLAAGADVDVDVGGEGVAAVAVVVVVVMATGPLRRELRTSRGPCLPAPRVHRQRIACITPSTRPPSRGWVCIATRAAPW